MRSFSVVKLTEPLITKKRLIYFYKSNEKMLTRHRDFFIMNGNNKRSFLKKMAELEYGSATVLFKRELDFKAVVFNEDVIHHGVTMKFSRLSRHY